MKLALLALAGLMVAVTAACGGKNTEIYDGTVVSGVIAATKSDRGQRPSETYTIFVREDVEYYIFLTSPNSNIAGVWSIEEDGYIIKANSSTGTRTGTHIFSETGYQTLFLKSLDHAQVSRFTFKIWEP